MMTSTRFPLISSPHDSMCRGDELVEISDEEQYDEKGYPVFSEPHRQAVRVQRLDMADYTHEEVYIKLS